MGKKKGKEKNTAEIKKQCLNKNTDNKRKSVKDNINAKKKKCFKKNTDSLKN